MHGVAMKASRRAEQACAVCISPQE